MPSGCDYYAYEEEYIYIENVCHVCALSQLEPVVHMRACAARDIEGEGLRGGAQGRPYSH